MRIFSGVIAAALIAWAGAAHAQQATVPSAPYASAQMALERGLGAFRTGKHDTAIAELSAAAAVNSLLEGITRALRKGDAITFVGFGTFKTAQRRARVARNPRTGDAIKIPKRRVVRFTAGKALKSAVR